VQIHIDPEDIEALAAILENEKQSHCRKRGLCFGLFVASFAVLIMAIVVLTFLLMTGRLGDVITGNSLGFLQVLAPLSALVVGFFGMWWAVQNCINSIERTLYAARAGRHRLFASFLEQLQCADKGKRRMLLDIVGSVVS
jgi:ABC-type nickel/cobalt efflux system permease component RcnA